MAKLWNYNIFEMIALICSTPLSSALARMTKIIKSYIFSLVCPSGLTALVNFKIIEMANQIKVVRVYHSQKQSTISTISQWGKMEVANHTILVKCFTIEMWPFWERDECCVCVITCICVSLSTNNEAVSLVTSNSDFTSSLLRNIV